MKHLLSVEGSTASGRVESGLAAACRLGLAREWGRMYRSAGFTLIELMIVVAIIAILTAIAYPSYTNYITKTRRVTAEGCLSEYSNYMERYYTTNLRYDQDTAATPVPNTLPPLDCKSTQRTGNDYDYRFPATASSLTASVYTVLAVPKGAQLTRDTKCGTLSLNQTGTRTVSVSGGNVNQCW